MEMKKILRTLVLGAVVPGWTVAVSATPIVTLSDGTSQQVYDNNSAGTGVDTDPTVGQVANTAYYYYNDGVWSTTSTRAGHIADWKIAFDATTYPQQGSPSEPYLDLIFGAQSLVNGAPDISISFTQDGFIANGLGSTWDSSIGGTLAAGAHLTFTTFFKNIGLGSQRFPLAGNTSVKDGFGGLTADIGGTLPAGTPYSLTETIKIHHNSKGQTTGDAFLETHGVPDAGYTLMLLGSSLSGLGAFRFTRKGSSAIA